MTIFETRTAMPPAVVIERARSFFAGVRSPYTAFPEAIGEGCLRLQMDLAAIVIGAVEQDGVTSVRGSASRGAHLLTRFLTTLGPPREARRTTRRHGFHEKREVLASTFGRGDLAAVRSAEPPVRVPDQAA